jgi:hypothetical protein
VAIDGERWQQDPTQEALRLFSSAALWAQWTRLAAHHPVPREHREDAVHAAIVTAAQECAVWLAETLPPDVIERRLIRGVGSAIHNWQRREQRTTSRVDPFDDGEAPDAIPGASGALRRKVLQLHVVGADRTLTDHDIGMLLLEIGRIRLSLAQLRASENRSEKQARYLAAEAMLEFDAARGCRVIARELAPLRSECRQAFALHPRVEDGAEEALVAQRLLLEASYRPYVEWCLFGLVHRHDEGARKRQGGDLHSLRYDATGWLRERLRARDPVTVLLWEKFHALRRLHPQDTERLVVMPRVRTS